MPLQSLGKQCEELAGSSGSTGTQAQMTHPSAFTKWQPGAPEKPSCSISQQSRLILTTLWANPAGLPQKRSLESDDTSYPQHQDSSAARPPKRQAYSVPSPAAAQLPHRCSGTCISVHLQPASPLRTDSGPDRAGPSLADLAAQANAAVRRQAQPPSSTQFRLRSLPARAPAERPLSLANRQALDAARR